MKNHFLRLFVCILALSLLGQWSMVLASTNQVEIPSNPQSTALLSDVPTDTFNCYSVTDVPTIECQALVTLYESTNGDDWYNHTNWLNTNTVGNWYGVTVGSNHVIGLNLMSNNLDGTLPVELGELSDLEYIYLSGNQLSGTIPSDLGNLSGLKLLYLGSNQLSGTIPSALGSLNNLEALRLDFNLLTGNIPPELGSLSNLQTLALADNQLSGNIPSELENLSKLTMLVLNDNKFSGNIPSELASLTSLQGLYLDNNQLSGEIPIELGYLTNLQGLGLSRNRLSGSIPSELGDLSNLRILYLSFNQLNGSIPSELGGLVNLESLELSYNQFSGNIPPQLGNLTNLGTLDLSNNQLNGSIPSELGNLSSLWWYLDLSNNQLTGSIPPALGNLSSLSNLDLSNNQLDGNIPLGLDNLSDLYRLLLNNNQLNGTIPSEFGNLTSLGFLNLAQNLLIGDVPASFTNLVNLCTPDITDYPCYGENGLDLGYNHLNVPAPDPLAGFLANKDPDWYLTQAVEEVIDPGAGGDLVSYDESTEVTVPAGAVSEEATFLLFPQPSPSQETGILDFAGNSFELTAWDADGPVTTFTEPLTVTLHYDEASLGVIPEDSLALYYWDESHSSWLDAVTTCSDGEYTRDLEDDWLSVPICHLSEFALMGFETAWLYLPLITR